MNLCHGCRSYGTICVGNESTDNIQCPCVKCLVKGMCGDSCEEYVSFSNYINRRGTLFSQQRVDHMKEGVK